MDTKIKHLENNGIVTAQELKARFPELWKAANEKNELIQKQWTPELLAALKKLRER